MTRTQNRLAIRSWVRTLRAGLPSLSAWLPFSCALCEQHSEQALCQACQARYLPAATRRCRQCALALAAGAAAHQRCGACLADRPPFDATLAAGDYGAPLDRLLLELKFCGRLALAPWMAGALARSAEAALAADGWSLPDLLCPVPLGPRRLAARGFNQALEIARPLARELGLALDARLTVRRRETAAQAQLPAAARARNTGGAFVLAPHALQTVRGLHVGVVDDVMTTGHTLADMAAMLKRFGAARVSNFVFARTAAPQY